MKPAKSATARARLRVKGPQRVVLVTDAARFATSRAFSASRELAQPVRDQAVSSLIRVRNARAKAESSVSARLMLKFLPESKMVRAFGLRVGEKLGSSADQPGTCT